MSKELIAKARELSAAATPGPWVYKAGDVLTEQGVMIAPDLYRGVSSLRDGKFIAESRTLLPALADLAESQERDLSALRISAHNASVALDCARAEARRVTNLAESEGRRADEAIEQIRNASDLWHSENGDGGPTGPKIGECIALALREIKELTEERNAALAELARLNGQVESMRPVADIKVLLAIVQRQAGELNRAVEIIDEQIAETEKWLAKRKQVMAERVADQHEIERLQNVAEHARSEVDQLTERLRKLQHGEAEALKMMAAQKVALLAAETALDSSRAEVLRTMRDLPTEKQMADTITLGIVAYRRHWDLQFRETALAVIEWEDTHGHLVPR